MMYDLGSCKGVSDQGLLLSDRAKVFDSNAWGYGAIEIGTLVEEGGGIYEALQGGRNE